jgi:hypothetical protein
LQNAVGIDIGVYNKTRENAQQKENEIENMKGQIVLMQQAQKEILDLLKDPAKLLEALNDN